MSYRGGNLPLPYTHAVHESEGTYMECVAGSLMNKQFSSGDYPQFIKKQDASVASVFFSLFRDGGFNGVQSYNATLTVPYK